jgi:imidazolonepropionase-like amidohydrolase
MRPPVRFVIAFALASASLLPSCKGGEPAAAPARRASKQRSPAERTANAAARVALTHVTVIDVSSGQAESDRTVVLEGEHIVSVGSGPAAGPIARTIDLGGKYVIPGLWDMHVHFATPPFGKLFVANGVTGVRVMWGNPRWDEPGTERAHFRMRERFDAKSEVGPRMVIASQLLDGPKSIWPTSVVLATSNEGRKAVDDAKKEGVDFIKVYSLLPRDVYMAIADESKKQGLPFAGHVPEAVSVGEASDAGQKSIEHLTGMNVACSSRELELRKRQADFPTKPHSPEERAAFKRKQTALAIASYDASRANALFAKFVANGTWQVPTFTVLHALANLDDPSLVNDPRLRYIPTFIKETWDPKEDFRMMDKKGEDYALARKDLERAVELVRAMNKAGVGLLAGTDEPNPYCMAGFSLHDELGWMVKAGLTPLEALRTATTGPAKFLGTTGKLGAVAKGMVADLVVLDADPRADIANTRKIAAVVSRGAYYERAQLDAMLEEAGRAQ